jgi:hypothetical protein
MMVRQDLNTKLLNTNTNAPFARLLLDILLLYYQKLDSTSMNQPHAQMGRDMEINEDLRQLVYTLAMDVRIPLDQ